MTIFIRMKKLMLHKTHSYLLALIFLIAFASKSIAQKLPPSTTWEGKISTLRLILKIREDSITKQPTAVFDSPDQAALGLKVSSLKITADSIYAYSAVIGGGFSGTFNSTKTEATGFWKQGAGSFPVTLKRVENQAPPRRPQMPKPPFPYLEEQVVYFNRDSSIQYGATLTLPKSDKNVPAVILITGSGQEDRDETLFDHKMFWVIADYLSRNGIAVLRVDDRGIGQTTGDVANATSADFAKDVLVGVEFLKKHKGIDLKQIGLVGHSEGGIIAPIAANQSKDIAFIVSLAGMGISGMELWNYQAKLGYVKAGFTEEELGRMDGLFKMMYDLSNKYPDMNDIKRVFQPEFEAWRAKQPEAFLLKSGLKGPNADRLINSLSNRFYLPWMRYLVHYDPEVVLSKIKMPVLAINGEKDVQVLSKPNLDGFRKYLTQAGNKQFKTISFPGLNHLFQHATTGEVGEYGTIEETISPEVLQVITAWIRGVSMK